MRIIDAHAHLGHDYVFDEEATEKELLYYYDKYNIAGAIVQPFISRPYLADTAAIHDRIHRFCQDYTGRIWGMASINPHFNQDDYEVEAVRCIKELGFVAIKITPIAHAAHPSSKDGRHVFEIARKLKVPVMVHTGAGIPFADPMSLAYVVKDFKDVTIILAHAGTDMLFQQALFLAKENDNVYLEPSWLSILNVRKALSTIGPEKIMFSSDHGINVPVELVKYRTLLRDEQQLERVLSGTAIEVFKLEK